MRGAAIVVLVALGMTFGVMMVVAIQDGEGWERNSQAFGSALFSALATLCLTVAFQLAVSS